MKVLFAVSNENISEAIIKRYKENFNELITYKNVYYFNAVIKELQTNYTYDRIVISEDLEVFSSSNELSIDKFLLNKLNRIVDEGKTSNGQNIPLIFISSEKRKFGSNQLKEYYSLGIYNTLIGNDRTITKICELIKSPRTKEEAKEYYQIEIDQSEQLVDNNPVSTTEIKNILRFFRGIAEQTEKFSNTFDRIVVQYNDEQLRYIIQKLPMTVKIVLEKENQNYRNLMSGKSTNSRIVIENQIKQSQQPEAQNQENNVNLNSNQAQNQQQQPQQPQNLNNNINDNQNMKDLNNSNNQNINNFEQNNNLNQNQNVQNENNQNIYSNQMLGTPINVEENSNLGINAGNSILNDNQFENVNIENKPLNQENLNKNKNQEIKEEKNVSENIENKEESVNNLNDNNYNQNINNANNNESNKNENKLEEEKVVNMENNDLISADVLDMYRQQIEDTSIDINNLRSNPLIEEENKKTGKDFKDEDITNIDIDNIKYDSNKKTYKIPYLEAFKNENKRIIAFVGTSKNGTSFLINSSAVLLSSIGIKTAILDMTKNRNSYYLATASDKDLKNKASTCFEKLEKGNADGIEISKTLSVFTSEPGNGKTYSDVENMYKTLLEEYDLILVDTDFDTNFGFYAGADEIFLVQSLDILTMQPLTKHLKDLKDENLISDNNLKIVINKEVALKGLSRKMVVGGISTYNNPSMSFMTKLFDKEKVITCSIPFDITVYQKYLENIVYCKYDISGYPKKFIEELKILASLIYPKYKNPEQINKLKNDNMNLKIEEGVFHKIDSESGNVNSNSNNNGYNSNPFQNINVNTNTNNTQRPIQNPNPNGMQNPNPSLGQNQNNNSGQTPNQNGNINLNPNMNPNMNGNGNNNPNQNQNPNPNLNNYGTVGGFYGFKHRASGQNYQINDGNINPYNMQNGYMGNPNGYNNLNSGQKDPNQSLNNFSNQYNPYSGYNFQNQNAYMNQNYMNGQNNKNNKYQQYTDTRRNMGGFGFNNPNGGYYNQNPNNMGNMPNLNNGNTNQNNEKNRFSSKISDSLNKMKNLFKR